MGKGKFIAPLALFCGLLPFTLSGCALVDSIKDGINSAIDGIVKPTEDTKKTTTVNAGESYDFGTKGGTVKVEASGENDVTVTTDAETGYATVTVPPGGYVTVDGSELTNDRETDMEIEISDGGVVTVLPDVGGGEVTNPDEGGETTNPDEGGDEGGSDTPAPVAKITNLIGGAMLSTSSYSDTLHTYETASGYTIRSIELNTGGLSGDAEVISAISASGNSIVLNIGSTNTLSASGTLGIKITFTDGTTEEDEAQISISVMCLTGDMLITMSDGTQKRIDSLSAGEKVLSFNPDTMNLEADEITYADSAENKSHTEYDIWTFADGTVVKTVHRHRLYNIDRQAMVNMDEWKIGEHAYNANGVAVPLVKHENVKETVNHYTIFTKNQNYFVNGLLSGNKYTAPMFLK